jgi:two-component system cell cycle response regulator DivK
MARILVVDDNETIRQLLAMVLTQEGHDIIEAEDGDMAVERARAEIPDLIVMDLNMPKMTGWEAGPILRSHPETRDIPIIALTADTSTEGREKAYAAGCDFFVVKPLAADRVLRAVNASLRAPSPRAGAGGEAEDRRPGAFSSSMTTR